MRAFLTSLVLVVAISAVTAAGIRLASQSAKDAYTQHTNVRL